MTETPTIPLELKRFEGCLLGLACGDAVGAAVEFIPRGRFPPVTDMTGGGKFRLQRGEWTDDTAMALCLAESLIECSDFDPLDQMRRYAQWANQGYNSSRPYAFGIGKTVAAALIRFAKTAMPYSGSTEAHTSGNGSLMRLAPIPMRYFGQPQKILTYAALSSQTTHASADCLAACQYFAHVLSKALAGETDKVRLLAPDQTGAVPKSFQRITEQHFRQHAIEQIVSSSYVVDSLEAALWCFWHTDHFKAAILAAANLGDDADTVAAICGQLAGAYYGSSQIPRSWREDLYRSEDIRQYARQLAQRAQQSLLQR